MGLLKTEWCIIAYNKTGCRLTIVNILNWHAMDFCVDILGVCVRAHQFCLCWNYLFFFIPASSQEEDSIASHLSAKPQSEHPSAVPSPLLPIPQKSQPVQSEAHDINPDVLSSGVLCQPGEDLLLMLLMWSFHKFAHLLKYILGTRDKSGHALVTVTMRNTIWLNPNCNSGELVRIMVYFFSTLR